MREATPKSGVTIVVTVLGLMGLLGGRWVAAQSTYGTLLGTVKDASGAMVPRANVVVTQVETSISKAGATNSSGDYEIPNLLPGTYNVAVTVPGFKKFVSRGIILDPRATVRVDATLEVGQVVSEVEVKGTAPIITTETATVSNAHVAREIQQLPINFRGGANPSPLQVVSTLPGVQVDPGFGIMISGSRPAQNEVSMDGFSVVSTRSNGPRPDLLPSTETVSEVRVVAGLGDAQYGQMGDISFVSKGGANQFHGSAFDFLQNSAADAVPLFASRKPPKVANDFGGSISGPVIVPHYNGKDRTFFFFDWESSRFNTSSVITQSVPTMAMRNGDFSAFCASFDANGICTDPSGKQLTDPFNGQPFAFNNLSASLNPTSQKIVSTFYPLPNFPTSGPADLNANFRTTGPSPIRTNQFDIRVDQNITSRQSIFGRFSWKEVTDSEAQGLLVGNEVQKTDPKSFGVSYNYSIRTNLLNEFRFGYEKRPRVITFPNFADGAKLIGDLGLQQLGPFPTGSGFPGFSFDQSPITSTLFGPNRDDTLLEKRTQFTDNLTWILGRHTLKFGTDIRKNQVNNNVSFVGPDQFGLFDFDGRFTGFDFADFLLGLPFQSTVGIVGPDFCATEWAFAYFGQDEFKVTPKLTLTYGLRYEYHRPFKNATLNITNFDRRNGDVVVPNEESLKLAAPGFLSSINACPGTPGATTPCTPVVTAQQDGLPETLRIADRKKFLPRFGFAYRLNNKTVIRGGAGHEYSEPPQPCQPELEHSVLLVRADSECASRRGFGRAHLAVCPARRILNRCTSGTSRTNGSASHFGP